MKLLCSLERKLLDMELRHQHREEGLQQVGAMVQSAAHVKLRRKFELL